MTELQGIGPDSLRSVLDSVFATRDYRWVVKPPPLGLLRHWYDEFRRWFQALRDGDPLIFEIVKWALLVLLVALAVHAFWVAMHAVRRLSPDGATPAIDHARRDQGWYRREANRLAADGRYPEAMQADFLALVLALDAASLLRFHPSKTPGEYAAASKLSPGAREELRALVRTLYGYVFARWPCGAREFADWRERAALERYATPQ